MRTHNNRRSMTALGLIAALVMVVVGLGNITAASAADAPSGATSQLNRCMHTRPQPSVGQFGRYVDIQQRNVIDGADPASVASGTALSIARSGGFVVITVTGTPSVKITGIRVCGNTGDPAGYGWVKIGQLKITGTKQFYFPVGSDAPIAADIKGVEVTP